MPIQSTTRKQSNIRLEQVKNLPPQEPSKSGGI